MIQNVLEVGVACIYSLSIFKVDHALLLMFISVFINVCAHVCVCVCVCAEKTRGHRPPRLENRVPWMVRVWPNTPIPITFVERDPGISFFLTHYSVLVVT